VTGVVLPEPYGYDVYVEEADNGYIAYNLDDPQLVDDATNHDATTTTLYTADQLRQAIADALAKPNGYTRKIEELIQHRDNALATEREQCAVLSYKAGMDGLAAAIRSGK